MVELQKMKRVQALNDKDLELVTNVEVPKPKDGQLLVKISSATIHPSDVLRAAGFFGSPEYPMPMGLEGYGKVVEDNSNSNLVGKYVAFWSQTAATWAEYSVVDVKDTIIAPEFKKEEFGKAANFYLNPITALGHINNAKKNGHKAILYNAASSAVGKMLTKIAKQEGIKTVAIVRGEDHVKELKELGATYVIDSKKENYLQELKQRVSELQISVFYECIGGADGENQAKQLGDGSQVNYYGALSGSIIPQKDLSENRGFKFHFLFFTEYIYSLNSQEKEELSKQIHEGIDSTYYTKISKTGVSLENLIKEYKGYLENMSAGKVIIEP